MTHIRRELSRVGCGAGTSALHLQTGENERAHRLWIIAARLLRHVVLVRAVAVTLLLRVAAEADDGDGAVDIDETVLVDVDELFEDAGVGAASGVAVLGVDVAEA